MEITKDDERARRICSLALAFMNASAPIPSSSIARDFYPDLSTESFRRAFSRDRAALAACGVVVAERPRAGEESCWQADEAASFASGAELDAREAAALEVACRPLLRDGGFAFAGELRFALAKITRAFAEGTAVTGITGALPREGRVLATLRSCLVGRRAARVTYTDAEGRRTERLIAPYGFFDLRGVLYLVAGTLDEDGREVTDGIRTYRVERFGDARQVASLPFEPPDDFSVADWRRLPFQMGDAWVMATFEVPPEREGDVRRAAGTQGSFERQGERVVWRVGVSDVRDAASWAVSQGVRPLGPEELVGAWREVLRGVLAHAS